MGTPNNKARNCKKSNSRGMARGVSKAPASKVSRPSRSGRLQNQGSKDPASKTKKKKKKKRKRPFELSEMQAHSMSRGLERLRGVVALRRLPSRVRSLQQSGRPKVPLKLPRKP